MGETGGQIYVTSNTEYHVRGAVCVGVRDRSTGYWLKDHRALRQRLAGGLRFQLDGASEAGHPVPRVGESLLFRAQGRDLITSPLLRVR